MDSRPENQTDDEVIAQLRSELAKSEPSRRKRIIEKFVLAALGSIPWIGGFLSAPASYKAEEGAIKQDTLRTQWLEEHYEKLQDLRQTISHIQERFESMGFAIE